MSEMPATPMVKVYDPNGHQRPDVRDLDSRKAQSWYAPMCSAAGQLDMRSFRRK
jgi:hypothetical protein